mgnify:CR=1 FL=1
MSNPFKRGDRVLCLSPHSDCGLVTGNIYTVSEVAGDFVGINEISNTGTEWLWTRFTHAAPTAPTMEATPDGIDQHAPGAKLDAGKLRPALVLGGFANALLAVTKVGTDGAAKYTDNGWREVANGFKRYSDAEGRHRLYREAGETHDKLSGSLHLAHEAWNALAKLELYLMENPE